MKNTMQEYHEMRRRASQIKNWYRVDGGDWQQLTNSEARKLARKHAIERAGVDKELELDGN